jgi:hypothetical protein
VSLLSLFDFFFFCFCLSPLSFSFVSFIHSHPSCHIILTSACLPFYLPPFPLPPFLPSFLPFVVSQ